MDETKTIKIGLQAYTLLSQVAKKANQSRGELATGLIFGGLTSLRSGLQNLSDALAEGESRESPGASRESPGESPKSPVTSLEGAKGQLDNPHGDNAEAEAGDDDQETNALATPFDKNEDGNASRWVGLGIVGILLLLKLASLGNQRQGYSNQEVM